VSETANVWLTLSNKAENVLLVRQALSGLAEMIHLDPVELNDVSTAVSEACNNVVLHAYEGGPGELEVEIHAGHALEVIVRDRGVGIQPREIDHEEMAGGIGLPVIRALTHEVEFEDVPGGGTEVKMRFETAHSQSLQLGQENSSAQAHAVAGSAPEGEDRLAIAVGPPTLARAVLPRVLSALAARAYFSTDRISDTQLLADAILAQAEDSFDRSRLNVEVEVKPRDLQLRIGPLREGSAEAVLAATTIDGLGSVFERLAENREITSQDGGSETLALRLADR
jgi:serine/threonine-protein kinase RsbW